MRNYYLAPHTLTHDAELGEDVWMLPNNTLGSVDLRGSNGGFAFVTTEVDIESVDNISFGTDLNAIMTTPQITTWENMVGINITGGPFTLLDLLWNTLTIWSDPTGVNNAKPITPTHLRRMELHLGGHSLIRKRRWMGVDDPVYLNVRNLYREDYRKIRQHGLNEIDIVNGITLAELQQGFSNDDDRENKYIDAARRLISNRGFTPAEAKSFIIDYIKDQHRKYLGAMRDKLLVNYQDLIPDDLPQKTPIDPTTTYTDDFTRASLGAGWTSVYRTWSIVSGEIFDPGGSSGTENASARYESDLSSDDHYSQIDFTYEQNSFAYMGPTARFSSSASTYYFAMIRSQGSLRQIQKVISGSATGLYSDAGGGGVPQTVKLQCNGSTISAYDDGVLISSLTDTSITGNLRCGLVGHPNVQSRGDNFVAEDLAASTNIPAIMDYYRRMRI